MNPYVKGALVASAVAGLLFNVACDGTGTTTQAKVKCQGVNECKGTGACAGEGHDCAGKNTCKGTGYVNITKAECDAKKGKVITD